MKCATSGILPVSRREQNEVDDFSKSTSLLKSTNRDSSKFKAIAQPAYSSSGRMKMIGGPDWARRPPIE